MATASRVRAKIQGLIDSANQMTKATDTNLTDAVGRLVTGYGSAGINAPLKAYKVKDGATVAAGDFVELIPEWGAGQLSIPDYQFDLYAVVALTESKIMMLCMDHRIDGQLRLALLSADGDSVTRSEYATLGFNSSGYYGMTALSDSKVLLVYARDSRAMHAVVLTVTGDTISVGESTSFSYTVKDLTLTALTDSKALVAFRDGNNYGQAMLLTVVGTTITAGALVNFSGSVTANTIKAVTLTDSKVLVAFCGSNNYGQAVVMTISDMTITCGSVYTFRSASTGHLALTPLNAQRALLVYRDNNSTGRLTAVVLVVRDRAVTTQDSPSVEVSSASGMSPALARISADKVLLAADFSAALGRAEPKVAVLTIGDTTITVSRYLSIDSTKDADNYLVASVENTALLVRGDNNTTSYQGLTVTGTTVALQTQGGTHVVPLTSDRYRIAVAKTAGGGGSTVYAFRAGAPASNDD